jgi:hypothetical protein
MKQDIALGKLVNFNKLPLKTQYVRLAPSKHTVPISKSFLTVIRGTDSQKRLQDKGMGR